MLFILYVLWTILCVPCYKFVTKDKGYIPMSLGDCILFYSSPVVVVYRILLSTDNM